MKIIGGPALRSTSSKAFYLWLVLDSRPASIEAIALKRPQTSAAATIGRSTQASQRPTRLGERLFLYMLKVRPTTSSFPLDKRIYYNVIIDGKDLASAELFAEPLSQKPITYGGDRYPGLIIPTKHQNIVQMSCRKPHGGDAERGNVDMVSSIDLLVQRTFDRTDKLPSLLFGTGDQIYADDVATPLLCAISALASDYVGWDEEMPGPRGNGKTIVPAKIQLGRRDSQLHKKRGFSSGKKDNHLMTFGEYICMYLVVFGGLPADMPAYEAVLDRIPVRTRKVGRRTVRRPMIQDDYEKERSQVSRFLGTSWKLRRIMANVPTHMIFDDHEVSDDWNLTKKNRDGMRKAGTLGRRLQANALAAYWACQGFGNNPEQFGRTFRKTVSDFVTAKTVSGGRDFESTLLAESWDYRIEGHPMIYVLDTRTQRAFPSREEFSSLMAPGAIRALGDAIADANSRYSGDIDGQSLLIVSAAPMLGFLAIERLQLGASGLPRLVDGEPWSGSQRAYKSLKNAIARTRFRECVVLSGDVHYAYARKLDLTNADGNPLSIFQLTSSASNNAPGGMRRFFVRQFEKKDLRKFNRRATPYLFPKGLEGEHFVDGSNNFGVLSLEDGRPVSNSFHFRDSSLTGSFTWSYDLNAPSIVDFS